MPIPDTADYEFRQPLETAETALGDLSSRWNALDDVAQAELTAVLASFRARLYQAEGDMARGTAMASLLHALDGAAHLPVTVAELLRARRRPTTRGTIVFYSDHSARAVVNHIDSLIGKDPALAPSEAPSDSDEEFPEAATTATQVIRLLNGGWKELSLQRQDQATVWLRVYYYGLETANNDYLRQEATYAFLRHIKADPVIYELAYTVFRGPTRPPGAGSFGHGLAAMSEGDAGAIKALINENPGLAAVPKTPWPADDAVTTAAPPDDTVEPAGTAVDFHTDVRFPGQVSTFERDVPLRVRLTLEKSEASMADTTFSFKYVTPEPKQVLVVCNAEGFIVDDDSSGNTRTILVYRDRDSQWAIFLLTPDPDAGAGVRRISLDFVHEGRLAGAASFEVEVRDRPPVDETPAEMEPVIVDRNADGSIAAQASGGILLASADAPKPDFVLRVALSSDRRRLSYTLHSPTGQLGLVYQRLGSVRLETDPRTFMENTLLGLSQMARASRKKLTDAQVAANQEKLRVIGWDLYEQLFTPALRRTYRSIRQLRQEQPDHQLSLLIVSDEPWIPWEMVLPHEDDLPDEDVLCAQFRMTRWLPGRGLPGDFGLRQARVVVPQSNLPSVKAEQDFFSQELPRLRPDITYGGAWLDMASQVTSALRAGDVQLFHFACHGDFDYTRPDESQLKLRGDPLRPSQIVGPMRAGVAASRPLVFLNACHTAEAGFSLTRMGGWAERFVRAGASAFVGSLWEVNDVLAAKFAIKFYSELLAGQTLGDAFHTARAHIRAEDDANPTWLAYTLYADPNGRVKPVNG